MHPQLHPFSCFRSFSLSLTFGNAVGNARDNLSQLLVTQQMSKRDGCAAGVAGLSPQLTSIKETPMALTIHTYPPPPLLFSGYPGCRAEAKHPSEGLTGHQLRGSSFRLGCGNV